MMQQHPRAAVAHDPEDLFLLWPGIAMNRTHTAECLLLHTRAVHDTGSRIISNLLAVRAQRFTRQMPMMMSLSIKADDLQDHHPLLLPFLFRIHALLPPD